MKRWGQVITAAILAATWAAPAHAVSFNRAYRTDDPYVVGLYRWEATGGLQYEGGEFDGRTDRSDWRFQTSFDYGLTRNLEIGAQWDVLRLRNLGEDGVGDLTVHAKGFLFESVMRSSPDFAIDLQVKIPTASEAKNLGTGEPDFGFHLLWGWNPNPDWKINLRLGRVVVGSAPGLKNRFEAGASLSRELEEKLWGFAEFNYDSNEQENQRSRQRLGLGVVYERTPQWTWDARIEAGFTRATPDFGVAAGVTYRP